MIYKNSTYYFRFFNEIEDRLDFAYNNPVFDIVTNLSSIAKFSVAKIGDIIEKEEDFSSGKTPKKITYQDNGIPFLGAGNISDDEIDFSNITFIDASYHTGELSSSSIIEGDVLISMAGTIGKACVYNEKYESNCNQAVARLRINKDKIIPNFISKFLMSKYGQLAFGKYRHDVSQPNINLEEIKLIPLVIPSYSIQKKILEKIKPLEKEVSKLKKELKKKKEEADNLMYRFLGFENYQSKKYFFKEGKDDTVSFWLNFDDIDNRFDFLHYHPKHKLIDELAKKIKLIKLKDILVGKIKRGTQPKYSDIGTVSVIKTTDLKDNYIDFENTLKVDEIFYDKNENSHVKLNDILFASTGLKSMGKVNVYNIKDKAVVDGHISIIKLKNSYDPYFITFYLRSDFGKTQIDKYFSGSSGQIEIQPKDLDNILIPSNEAIPKNKQEEISKKIQEAINRSLEIEEKIKELKDKIKIQFEKELFNE